jgi:hypothetical protein
MTVIGHHPFLPYTLEIGPKEGWTVESVIHIRGLATGTARENREDRIQLEQVLWALLHTEHHQPDLFNPNGVDRGTRPAPPRPKVSFFIKRGLRRKQ